ncbi:hypothetical protein ACTFIW_003491 [Dictyostelium discoideum]
MMISCTNHHRTAYQNNLNNSTNNSNNTVDNKKIETPQGTFQPAIQSTSNTNLNSLASSVNNGASVGSTNGSTPNNSNGSTPTYNHNNSAEELEKQKKEEDEKRKKSELEAAAAVVAKKKEDEEKQRKEQVELERKKREEEIRRTNAAAANAANKELNEQVEISSLEQMGKLDPSSTIHDMFSFFPNEVYNSYEKLQYFSRDLNTAVSHPEIVFVGPRSSGKSSLIEAFIGRALNIVGGGNITGGVGSNANGCSKRVLYLQFTNNIDFEVPKVTIKKDNTIKEFDHDIIVSIEQLNENLAKRNQLTNDYIEEPIYVSIESRTTLNLTLIDSPGLLFDQSQAESNKIESIVSSLLRPSHRLIIAVESCSQDWKSMSMGQYLKKIDPELSRSTFVFTKFHHTVRGFSSTRDINKYLSGTVPDIKGFFVTLPNHQVRASYSEANRFQEKIYQAHKRDMHALEQLQYDKRYERTIGVAPLRRYILNIVWKSYQDTIPRILKHLRSKRQTAEATLNELQKQSSSLDSTKLRSIASNYTVTFLQITEKLLSGTSEGNPSANGQTLDEEKSQQGDCGEWVDAYKEAIYIDPEEWNIPYWSSKLYGGQQLERLMAEFKAVCDNSKISEVKMDDIATASGINKLNNIPNYAWAASDLTSLISRDTFVPLIEQLCERAMYIMKRLTDIADKVIDSRRKSRCIGSSPFGGNGLNNINSGGNNSININDRLSNTDMDSLDQYPFFTHHVKNLYYDFVHRAAKGCKEKCMDEFYSSRTIYWELTEHPDSSLPSIRNDHHETKTAVCQLATKLFDSIRHRITKNVLLKLYNFFLVPMQTDLWNEIQAQITCLSNEQLEQLFEVQATREQLKQEEKKQQQILEKYSQIDEQFLKAASLFCRPLSNPTPSA